MLFFPGFFPNTEVVTLTLQRSHEIIIAITVPVALSEGVLKSMDHQSVIKPKMHFLDSCFKNTCTEKSSLIQCIMKI